MNALVIDPILSSVSAVGGSLDAPGAAAEPLDRDLAVPDRAENERGRFDREKQDFSGKADRFVEQSLSGPCGIGPWQSSAGKKSEDVARRMRFLFASRL